MLGAVTSPALRRDLGTGDAVVVGLSAMIGAGVFAVFAPAARAAGSWLLLGLAIAAGVAFCNAVASAQLARRYPVSGGSYAYGREVLGPWWGFLAGWGYVIGKTASCAAMAMTFAAYAVPDSLTAQRVLGVSAVVALTVATLVGITKTARVAMVLLVVTLAALVVVIGVGGLGMTSADPTTMAPPTGGVYGVLQAGGLIFFAFAGYARIATLGEEVRRPEFIGRAILIAFAIAVALYAVIATELVAVLGGALAGASAPLHDLVVAAEAAWAVPVVRVGAAAASLGALLALLAGVSRMTFAMAREHDLPTGLAAIDPRHHVPRRAQLLVGLAIILLVLGTDLRGAIGFSSFGVLLYYAVANLAASRQPTSERQWPRVFNLVGLAGCLVLVVTLPWTSVLIGAGVLAVGLAGRLVARRRTAQPG